MSKPFVLIPISLSHVCALFPQSTWTLLLSKCSQSAHASLHPFSCSYIHSILYCHFLFFTLFSKVLIKLPKKMHIFMSFFRFVDDNKGKNRVHLVGWVFLPPLRRDRCVIPYPKIYFESARNFGRSWNTICPTFLFLLYFIITLIKRGELDLLMCIFS